MNPAITCDINSKKWLNPEEAITYIGYGSVRLFYNWRNGVEIKGKMQFLPYYKDGKNVIYKRTDIDAFLEHFKQE